MTATGVKDLRSRLSRYVERAAAGELVVVTEHGRAVALLGPLPPGLQKLDAIRRQGRIRWSGGKPAGLPPKLRRVGRKVSPDVSGAVVKGRKR